MSQKLLLEDEWGEYFPLNGGLHVNIGNIFHYIDKIQQLIPLSKKLFKNNGIYSIKLRFTISIRHNNLPIQVPF